MLSDADDARYENIYHLLSGSKTFRLFAPVEGYLMDSKSRATWRPSACEADLQPPAAFYPAATYTRPSAEQGPDAPPLIIRPDPEPTYPIPWTSVDPLRLPPDSPLRPIEVTVEQGWTLFLPAGWYHHVTQEPGPHGICVAVN